MLNHNPMLTFLLILLLLTQNGCNDSDETPEASEKDHLEITLFPSQTYQTIRYFGASDAWSCQFVGKNWPEQKKDQIADWLFSDEYFSNGNPKGIGLKSWRFNIGAGSMYQGGTSGINDEWRRAECFLTSNSYDWNAHEGQRWFLQAAKKRGVNHFTGFVNSPPTVMTKNGKAHSSGGSSANIATLNYDDYANFLTEVVRQMAIEHGIVLAEISPFNEPQWDWLDGQEGSPWMNSEISQFSRILDNKLQSKGLQTKLELAEAGKLNYLYEDGDKPGRASQLQAFFDSKSAHYLGDLRSVDKKINGHSYYTTYGNSSLIEIRNKLNDQIKKTSTDFEFWMTEYCLLENNSEINGSGRDLGIDPALYLAKVIYADLAIANASTWQWWLAVSPYDYKDGLVYIDNNKNDGQIYDSKLLWVFGNYSKFIKPGYKRIDIKRSDNQSTEQSISGLLVSAYKSPSNNKFVVVLVNQRNISLPLKISIEGLTIYKGKKYLTSGLKDDNLALKGEVTQEEIWNIPGRSIITVAIE